MLTFASHIFVKVFYFFTFWIKWNIEKCTNYKGIPYYLTVGELEHYYYPASSSCAIFIPDPSFVRMGNQYINFRHYRLFLLVFQLINGKTLQHEIFCVWLFLVVVVVPHCKIIDVIAWHCSLFSLLYIISLYKHITIYSVLGRYLHCPLSLSLFLSPIINNTATSIFWVHMCMHFY